MLSWPWQEIFTTGNTLGQGHTEYQKEPVEKHARGGMSDLLCSWMTMKNWLHDTTDRRDGLCQTQTKNTNSWVSYALQKGNLKGRYATEISKRCHLRCTKRDATVMLLKPTAFMMVFAWRMTDTMMNYASS